MQFLAATDGGSEGDNGCGKNTSPLLVGMLCEICCPLFSCNKEDNTMNMKSTKLNVPMAQC